MGKLGIGKKSSTGQVVKEILGQSPKATVFTTEDQHLRWQYHDNDGELPEHLFPALNQFDSLLTDIKSFVRPEQKPSAFFRAGHALFCALNISATEGEDKVLSCFEPARCFVAECSIARAQFLYTLSSLAVCTALVFILLAAWLLSPVSMRVLIVGSISGVVGSTVSILQRSHKLDLEPRQTRSLICLQSAVRVSLGAIFGTLFVVASKANLVFGPINENPYALSVFAVAAGFSERLIPELLARLEGTASSADTAYIFHGQE